LLSKHILVASVAELPGVETCPLSGLSAPDVAPASAIARAVASDVCAPRPPGLTPPGARPATAHRFPHLIRIFEYGIEY
jgi:hypothetical protein